jgi:hypothetical protein
MDLMRLMGGAIAGWAHCNGWNGGQTCGFHMFDLFDTVPLNAFKPLE